ncbi:MAG: RNA polymerase sigma factor [Flavisolibacter sp.]
MRILAQLSDKELIEEVYKGQEQAFEILFSRYKKDVRTIILRCVSNRLVTEDLCQDSFIRVFNALRKRNYNEQGNFRAWILCVARNLCMDYLRKSTQFNRSGIPLYDDCVSTTAGDCVENRMVMKQQEQQLLAFINRLPEEQKQVVHYRFFEGMSFKEISALMKTNVNTSQGRMRYGLAHLRKQVRVGL